MPKLKYLKLNYSTNEKKLKYVSSKKPYLYDYIPRKKSKKAIEEDE